MERCSARQALRQNFSRRRPQARKHRQRDSPGPPLRGGRLQRRGSPPGTQRSAPHSPTDAGGPQPVGERRQIEPKTRTRARKMTATLKPAPDSRGRFGPYGGRYVPETLVAPLEELEHAYADARKDPDFQSELDSLLRNFAGRPTPLQLAARLSAHLDGPRIY